ncbi:hypothetical protein BDQ17DRAFT_1234308, partial [Cyathus striatus]
IHSSGDWLIAWDQASEEISFAFPHRWQELHDYGHYINKAFVSRVEKDHVHVIRFDDAVHSFVAPRHDLQLTDVNAFQLVMSKSGSVRFRDPFL